MSKTDFPKYPTSMLDKKMQDIFENVDTYIQKMSKMDFLKYTTSMLDKKI
jgi:hypothetical protein